jgi:tetrahydromethanopterin S-methyltransferase subunit A
MAAMRMGQTAAVADATPVPSWPVSFGAYTLGDPEGSVAICTLASDGLSTDLAGQSLPGVAIIGRAFTENFGVEKVVANLVANPRIRTLVLCGTESRHHVGQTLLALHANGRDAEGRVVGSEGPLPMVRSLADVAVRIYREKLTVVDLRGEGATETILAKVHEVLATDVRPWPEQWEPQVPTVRLPTEMSMAGRFTPDPTGFFLIGVGPWRDSIDLEHYTREGFLDYRLRAASADALCRALLEAKLVGDLSHALYLGREFQKAEMALHLHIDYEQDRALDMPRA